MLTTTEFRSHWIDSAGRCYAQRHPFDYEGQLTPVLNLDEVRAWLALATSDGLRRLGFPGGMDDGAVWGMSRLIEAVNAVGEGQVGEPYHAIARTCLEFTDEIPRYHQSRDDWRTPFVEMRERWPLPQLGGVSEVRNLTPHAVVVGEMTIAPSGIIARATEESTPAEPIRMSVPEPSGAASDRYTFDVPTSTTRYTGLVDLPNPEPGVYLVVSMVVPPVAAARGRWTGDLLTPGQQVRDAAGRIVGCRSLSRVS